MSAPALKVYGQGQGVVSGDNMNTWLQGCDTLNQLRGLVGIPGIEVSVRGTSQPNDGGGGFYFWNATDQTADNGHTVIQPFGYVGAGRWNQLGIGTGTVLSVSAGVGLNVGAGPGGSITSFGTLNVAPATTTTLGGVIVGSGLVVNAGGTLSNSGATGSVTGVVAGTGLAVGTLVSGGTITGTGTLNLTPASTAALGGLVVGSGLSVNAGGTVSNSGATGSVTGVVAGTGLAVGTLSSGGTITGSGTLNLAPIASHDLLANTGTVSAAPTATSVSALFDAALGSAQGDLIYRGSSAWGVLSPGTSGQVLQTGGTAGNPSWVTGSTGSVTGVVGGTGLNVGAGPGGTISTSGTLNLAAATTAALGGVVVGSGLAVSSGTISATGGGGSVTAVVAGTGLAVGAGPGGTITGSGTLNLTAATTAALGGVIVGSGLVVNAGGTISSSGTSGSGGLFASILSATPTSTSTGYSTWVNQGATAAFANTAMGLSLYDMTNAAAENWRILTKTVPSGNFTATGLFIWTPYAPNFVTCGFGFRASGGAFQYVGVNSRAPFEIGVIAYSSPTSFSGFTTTLLAMGGLMCWFRLQWDGTDAYFWASGDGVIWQKLYSVAPASGFLGSGGYTNQLFIGVDPNGGGVGMTLASYAETSP